MSQVNKYPYLAGVISCPAAIRNRSAHIKKPNHMHQSPFIEVVFGNNSFVINTQSITYVEAIGQGAIIHFVGETLKVNNSFVELMNMLKSRT